MSCTIVKANICCAPLSQIFRETKCVQFRPEERDSPVWRLVLQENGQIEMVAGPGQSCQCVKSGVGEGVSLLARVNSTESTTSRVSVASVRTDNCAVFPHIAQLVQLSERASRGEKKTLRAAVNWIVARQADISKMFKTRRQRWGREDLRRRTGRCLRQAWLLGS